MQLEPGPIPELEAPVDPAFGIETPGFGPFVRAALSNTDALDLAFPDLEQTMLTESLTTPGAIIDAALGDAPAQLGPLSQVALGAETSQGIDDYTNADELLQNAWSTLPGESFQPVPPALSFPGAPPAVPAPGPGTITLANVTRPNDTNYRVGDVVNVQIRVLPQAGGFSLIANLPLTWWIYDQGGGPLVRKIDVGSTDQNGFLGYTLTLDYTWLGYWGINVETPGPQLQDLVAQFHLPVNVTQGPLSDYPRPITAELVNTTRPGHLDFLMGDRWTLTIRQTPKQSVVIRATLDGVLLADTPVGNTDDNGVLVINGQMVGVQPGEWAEKYIVGGVRSIDPLVFTVR